MVTCERYDLLNGDIPIFTTRPSSCDLWGHGDLGNLEPILQASLILDNPRWKEELNRLAAGVVESIEQDGWLCGTPNNVETPGLMTGLAGIGFELLRLAEPLRVPSVLCLEPPCMVKKL